MGGRMKKKRILFIIYSLFPIFLIGCIGIQKKDLSKEQPLLESATFLKFSDVPIPSGFKFLAKDSYLFEGGLIRTGLLRYAGKSSGDQMVNFYKEQMSMYGWRLLNVVEYGKCILNFEKEDESCIIKLEPSGSKLDITISVVPRPLPTERKTERGTKSSVK